MIAQINAFTDFELLEVKVPFTLSGTVGFLARREGRYYEEFFYPHN